MLPKAKAEIADSIFFHAGDINQTVYNYSWKEYTENKKNKKEDEEEKKAPLPKKIFKKA